MKAKTPTKTAPAKAVKPAPKASTKKASTKKADQDDELDEEDEVARVVENS